MKYISKSIKQTGDLAKELAKNLRGGEVLAMVGELGAGKTTFTQSLAKALGVQERVTSPTFVIMKVYKTKHQTIKNLVHIDAYRLGEAVDLSNIGWTDWQDKNSVVVIEWADKVAKQLGKETIYLKFVLTRAGGRIIEVNNLHKKPATKTK